MSPTGSRIRRLRTRLRRWRERDSGRRILLVRAAALVLGFRVALRVFPFSRVMELARGLEDGAGEEGEGRGLIPRLLLGRSGPDAVPAPETMGRDVEAAARMLASRRPCLPQALACHVLLRRAGHPATLYIGVRRPGDGVRRPHDEEPADRSRAGPLDAHAWVESEGRVVAGGEASDGDGSAYKPLMTHAADPIGGSG